MIHEVVLKILLSAEEYVVKVERRGFKIKFIVLEESKGSSACV